MQKVLAFGSIKRGRTARICAGGYEFSEGFTHQMKIPRGMSRKYWGKHKILAAAIYVHWRDQEGVEHKRVFSAPPPKRHHDVFMVMRDQGIKIGHTEIINEVQGFNCSTGFVDRRVALMIAQNAGQVVCKKGAPDILFSEDMW
ncbi:hypothetical protein [Acetobacter senegalensis]|uniref:hypothetical protein n=1 Tax=Acetobacter senegalensis TaxID=446692 RepID=UPI001EDAA8D3|nr:hypothetical protein [Acetobacter senegalensis]MCG4256909.1 hypothetical protein [Acetobacter senegalensis]MCG4266953.1 hypothetical protein [Acetobacter senegalensis]